MLTIPTMHSISALARRSGAGALLRTLTLALAAGTALAACGRDTRAAPEGTAANVAAATTPAAPAAPAAVGVVQLDTAAIRVGGIQVGTAGVINSSGLPLTGAITYDANRVSHVGARTEGQIVELRANLGARVARGQVLALLESPMVGQIRADEHEAEALVGIARENYAREMRLAEQGISSRKELLTAEAELRRSEASLRSAQEKLRVLGAGDGSGGQFAVTAPFSGAVVARNASPGEVVAPSDTLFTVADLSRVWIELDVFERDLQRVRVGQPVDVTVTACPGRVFPGRIVYVGDVLDLAKRTVRARIEVPNTGAVLKPGMFARAVVQVGSGSPAVVVPRDAVQDMGREQVVFVPGARPGEFRTVPVEVGESVEGNRVVIRAGLEAGARVVTAGAFALRSALAKSEIGEGSE